MAARRTSISDGPQPLSVADARAPYTRDIKYQPPAAPAAPAPAPAWTPAALNRPQVPYPSRGGTEYLSRADLRRIKRGTRGGGFGGGGGFNGMAQNFESTASLGPGAYWPGHGAEFQRDSQMAAIMPQLYQGYIGGQLQPGAMAAYLQYQNAGGTVGAARRAHAAQWGTYGGRGGGGGGLAGGWQDAFNAANQANEARYDDVLGGHQARRDANRGAGAQEAKDINTTFDAQAARTKQHLIGSGLSNSTVLDTMLTGNERERTDAQGRLGERLRREDADLLADQLGFMERRTDEGPDPRFLAQLAEMQGQAGGAAGLAPQRMLQTYTAGGGGGFQMPVGGYAPRQTIAARNRFNANRQHWLRFNGNRAFDALGPVFAPVA